MPALITLLALVKFDLTRLWQVPVVAVVAQHPVRVAAVLLPDTERAEVVAVSFVAADFALSERLAAWLRQMAGAAVVAQV